MLKTLNDIRDKIINHYEPERIILFGSYGMESFKQDSDMDLFIIKNTDKRPVERQIEIESVLSDRSIPLDIIVYTTDEVRYLFSIGSPFIEEVMENGRLLYMRKATELWLKDANEDLESAIILCDHEKYRAACYHSQQCLEKGLKSVVLEKGKRPERIHDIVSLLNGVINLGFEAGLTRDDAVFLNSVYKGRYPTEQGLLPHGEPSQKDAERAILVARSFMEKLKKELL